MPNACREQRLPSTASRIEQASWYVSASSIGRMGAGNTLLLLFLTILRAKTSQLLGPLSGRPIGTSMTMTSKSSRPNNAPKVSRLRSVYGPHHPRLRPGTSCCTCLHPRSKLLR
jgi:hypothetical protein